MFTTRAHFCLVALLKIHLTRAQNIYVNLTALIFVSSSSPSFTFLFDAPAHPPQAQAQPLSQAKRVVRALIVVPFPFPVLKMQWQMDSYFL
jgi:hypothetical protein